MLAFWVFKVKQTKVCCKIVKSFLHLSKPMEFVALVGVPALDPEYVLFSYMEVVINPVVAMLLGRGRLGPDGVFLILTAPDPVVSLAALGDRPEMFLVNILLVEAKRAKLSTALERLKSLIGQ